MRIRKPLLDTRKEQILKAVIMHHIKTAEPVSSQALVDNYGFEFSSATMRNELAQLEQMGYLTHPHTSAGRIPTDAGYRYFVDNMIGDEILDEESKRIVNSIYEKCGLEIEAILREMVELVSSMTSAMAIAVAPSPKHYYLKHIELVPITSEITMLVVITTSGEVFKKIFERSPIYNALDLQAVANILNSKFTGRGLHELASWEIDKKLVGLVLSPMVSKVKELVKELLSGVEENRVFSYGSAYLLRAPDFEDIMRIQKLLSLLEQKYFILQLAGRRLASGELLISIGSENPTEELRQCSFLLSGYGSTDRLSGSIGVIGPVRMDYRRAVTAIKYVADSLSQHLEVLGERQ